jgi:hypothetical protein
MACSILSDTDPEAEAFQIELLRRATAAKRVGLALSFSATMISLARRAIERAHPDLSDEERSLMFVDLHYGRELAGDLRRHLAARKR